MIGTTIGNYVVKEKIGEGGMGVVYLAEHPRIGRQVAIKVLLPEYSQNPEVVARFFTEARASSAIKNEHIIDIIDFGELPDKSSYIIMEWLEGAPLTKVLQEGKMPVDRALHIARGMGRALAAAHSRGIVHRDLKPDNVFLVVRGDDHDFAKVLDFGIAKLLGNEGAGAPQIASKTRTGAIIGTPMYMSPEQCRGVAVDERSDIYSFAVILYQMLCGKVPFESEGLGELLLKHMTEAPQQPRELVPDLPITIELALLKALEKDPAKRYRRVEDFVAELGGQPTANVPAVRPTLPLAAPAATAVHAHASAIDTIGAANGETMGVVASPPRRGNAVWLLVPALVVGGIGAIMVLRGPNTRAQIDPIARTQVEPDPQTTKTVVGATVPEVVPAKPIPDPKDPPAPARVRFDVRALPREALLFIDGKQQINPYAADLLADGHVYDVQVNLAGFASQSHKVKLDHAQTIVATLVAEHPGKGTHEKGRPGTRLPAPPPGTPDSVVTKGEAGKPDPRPAAKNDAPVPKKQNGQDGKDEKGAPIYKGTKVNIISDYPPSDGK